MDIFEKVEEYKHNENTVSGIKYLKAEESWWKTQFRKTSRWRNFVKRMLVLRGNQCERCHSSHNLIVHHKDPLRYKNLNEKDFAVLCNKCHLIVESQCKSEEQMHNHPENRKWHTYYPYNYEPLRWQSGKGTIDRWRRELYADTNKPEVCKTEEQIREAEAFMLAHPELFNMGK